MTLVLSGELLFLLILRRCFISYGGRRAALLCVATWSTGTVRVKSNEQPRQMHQRLIGHPSPRAGRKENAPAFTARD